MKLKLLLLTLAATITGCATSIDHEVVASYPSAADMIRGEFPKPTHIAIHKGDINPFSLGRLQAPEKKLTYYCQNNSSGRIVKLKERKPFYTERLNAAFGDFGCLKDDKTLLWVAIIEQTNDKYGYVYYTVKYTPGDLYVADKALDVLVAQEERRKEAAAKANFDALAVKSKSIGQQVCTAGNNFGYVKEISGNNILVYVHGRANLRPYGFFFPEDYQFRTNPINSEQWHPANSWAMCSFTTR